MKTARWKKYVCAAGLTLLTAYAFQALAGVPAAPASRHPPKAHAAETVLLGRRLVAFAGYELNVAFTPEGKLLCFEISAAAEPRPSGAPRA